MRHPTGFVPLVRDRIKFPHQKYLFVDWIIESLKACFKFLISFFFSLQRALQSYNYLTEEEIEDLCTSCGLTNFSSKVQQSFIMFSAQKP